MSFRILAIMHCFLFISPCLAFAEVDFSKRIQFRFLGSDVKFEMCGQNGCKAIGPKSTFTIEEIKKGLNNKNWRKMLDEQIIARLFFEHIVADGRKTPGIAGILDDSSFKTAVVCFDKKTFDLVNDPSGRTDQIQLTNRKNIGCQSIQRTNGEKIFFEGEATAIELNLETDVRSN